MLKDVTGAKLKGKCFENETVLKFYNKEEERISIIFGRNGSGKSSFAEGVSEHKTSTLSQFSKFDFIDKNNNTVNLSETNKDHIFIFNEEFIENNIKLKETGLDTIIMIGNQVELDKLIQAQEDL